jgi:hypothetical protein
MRDITRGKRKGFVEITLTDGKKTIVPPNFLMGAEPK